jgi:hypothetical protein
VAPLVAVTVSGYVPGVGVLVVVVVVEVVWWPPHPAATNSMEMVAKASSRKGQPILRRRPRVNMAAVLRNPNGSTAESSKS